MKRKPNKKRIPIIIVIIGIFCPIIFVLYFLINYNSDVSEVVSNTKTLFKNDTISENKINANIFSNSITNNKNEDKNEFTFIDARGNLSKSGGIFIDWAGNPVCWGNPFTDHRGNLVPWGSPFYDNKDNYVGWGNPFYDAQNNYINPRG